MHWITMHLRSYTPRAHKRKMSVEGHSARVVAHSALWAHSAQVVAPQTVAAQAAEDGVHWQRRCKVKDKQGTHIPTALSTSFEVSRREVIVTLCSSGDTVGLARHGENRTERTSSQSTPSSDRI